MQGAAPSIRETLATFQPTPHHSVLSSGARGDFPLPKPITGLWTAYSTAAGQPDTADNQRAVAGLVEQLLAAVHQNAETILTEQVQPTLTALLNDKVHRAVDALGWMAHKPEPPVQLLTHSQREQRAWLALDDYTNAYRNLRATWANLRHLTNHQTADPAGLDSIHATFADLPDHFPRWRDAVLRKLTWPWGDSDRLKLTWAASKGARLWLPTAQEQNGVWTLYEQPQQATRVGRAYRAPYMAG